MIEKWSNERDTENRESLVNTSYKTVQDFLQLVSAFPHGLPLSFDDTVNWIIEQCGELAELEQRAIQIIKLPKLQNIADNTHLLMTLACAVALARSPSLQTWRKVKTFKYNSWQLEHWLTEAMIAHAEINTDACNAYVELAKDAFAALDNFTLQSSFSSINQERSGALAYWSEHKDKLEWIWQDLLGRHGFMNYEEELPLFRVFHKLESDEYIRVISQSTNPYLVSALLFVAGIGAFHPRLAEWKRMVAAAPAAFEEGGKWNGSVLMPLLLVEARKQLLHTGQNQLHQDTTACGLETIKQEIVNTAEMIAATLATRQDASAIFSRWSPWLMRQILRHTSTEFSDVKSAAFADDTLIDAIGRKLNNQIVPHASPEDAPLWESWCYLCTLSSFAYHGNNQLPNWSDFLLEWDISPEDWASRKGRDLYGHASLITTLNKETPGLAANLLAYPISQSESPTETWIGLWSKAITLREIVEFGDSDATEDEYNSRTEAGRLLLLLFRIGLAIFDQGAAKCSNNNAPNARSFAQLYKALFLAAREMREIDTTLNHDEWLVIVQHLAVRRLIWEGLTSEINGETKFFQVFSADDTPTLGNYLTEAKSDVIELQSLLQSILMNLSDTSRIQNELRTASIDISDLLESIRSLNQYHKNKYPINEAQVQVLENLKRC